MNNNKKIGHAGHETEQSSEVVTPLSIHTQFTPLWQEYVLNTLQNLCLVPGEE